MVKLICFLKRKAGMSPAEFHAYWRDHHGPLVASTKSGSHVLRYEQNPRALGDYGRGDHGYDGVTEQWFASLEDFHASLAEDDYRLIDEDIHRFLDVGSLVFIMTEEPRVIIPAGESRLPTVPDPA
ncbi:MAG: EthD domain-containing protein [Acidimicrobiales bacterium]